MGEVGGYRALGRSGIRLTGQSRAMRRSKNERPNLPAQNQDHAQVQREESHRGARVRAPPEHAPAVVLLRAAERNISSILLARLRTSYWRSAPSSSARTARARGLRSDSVTQTSSDVNGVRRQGAHRTVPVRYSARERGAPGDGGPQDAPPGVQGAQPQPAARRGAGAEPQGQRGLQTVLRRQLDQEDLRRGECGSWSSRRSPSGTRASGPHAASSPGSPGAWIRSSLHVRCAQRRRHRFDACVVPSQGPSPPIRPPYLEAETRRVQRAWERREEAARARSEARVLGRPEAVRPADAVAAPVP
eukprot:scaffold33561_cov112-Isochrysis_galbana.AAC.1